MIKKDDIWINKVTGGRVLILRVGDCYVNYQQDKNIKQLTPDEFIEGFEQGAG